MHVMLPDLTCGAYRQLRCTARTPRHAPHTWLVLRVLQHHARLLLQRRAHSSGCDSSCAVDWHRPATTTAAANAWHVVDAHETAGGVCSSQQRR
jgi:hypothetical protein